MNCSYCNKQHATYVAKKRHFETVHARVFKCFICNTRYTQKEMKTHFRACIERWNRTHGKITSRPIFSLKKNLAALILILTYMIIRNYLQEIHLTEKCALKKQPEIISELLIENLFITLIKYKRYLLQSEIQEKLVSDNFTML